MADDPTINDPYGQEYQKQMLEKLAPQVEAQIKRLFPHSRGARFGAQGALLSRAMAKLQLEIAMDAAKRSAEYKERRYQEDRKDRLDRERWNRQQGEKLRQESNARTDAAMARTQNEWAWRDYQKQQAEAKKAEDYKQLVRENYNPSAPDKGVSVAKEKFNLMYPSEPEQPGIFEAIASLFKKKKEPEAAGNVDPYTKAQADWEARINAPESAPASENLFKFGTTRSKFEENTMEPFQDQPGFMDERGWRSKSSPVASERAGSEVAALGPVKGPGAVSVSGPEGSWVNANIPQLPGVNVAWKDRRGETYTKPGGMRIGDIPEPRNPWDKNYVDPGNLKAIATNKAREEVRTRALPEQFGGGRSPGGVFNAGVTSNSSPTGPSLRESTGFWSRWNEDERNKKNPTPAIDRNRWSGDINAGTPNEFTKAWRGAKNTTTDIYRGFRSIFS